jgi:hypothetical protein
MKKVSALFVGLFLVVAMALAADYTISLNATQSNAVQVCLADLNTLRTNAGKSSLNTTQYLTHLVLSNALPKAQQLSEKDLITKWRNASPAQKASALAALP